MAWWLTPRTLDPEVGGSSPTLVAMLCPWARHIYPPKSTDNTQEAVAQSQHDLKIVYRDVKHQTKPKPSSLLFAA